MKNFMVRWKMAQKGVRMFPRNRRPLKDSLHWVGWTYILIAIDWCSLESPELIQWCRHRTAAPHLSTPHCWGCSWTRCAGKLLYLIHSPSRESATHPANLDSDGVPRIGWQRMRSGWHGTRCVPGLLWRSGSLKEKGNKQEGEMMEC